MLPTLSACTEELFSSIREWSGSGRPAILAPGRQAMDYAQLADTVDTFSAFLAGRGLRRGDAIALAMPDGPEFLTTFLAVSQAAVCAPLNPAFKEAEFEYFLKDLRAQALVLPDGEDSQALAVAARLGIEVFRVARDLDRPAGSLRFRAGDPGRHSPEPEYPADVALLLHTSATTGLPKLVPRTHAQFLANAANTHRAMPPLPGDRTLVMVPLFHIYGLMAALSPLCIGDVVIPTAGFRPARFLDWLAEFQPTSYTGNPTMHRAVLSLCGTSGAPQEMRCLRYATSSGAPLPPETRSEMENRFGIVLEDGYGSTEAGRITTSSLDPARRRAGSVGMAVGAEVAILGPDGRFLSPGEPGEILVRGPSVMSGYAHNPEANAGAFHGDWFRSGDQGYLDADGYLFLTGRLKEMINRGGEKVLPYEVEAVLRRHPAVGEVAVFGYPHPRLGEDVGAAIVPAPGAQPDPDELRRFAAQDLATFKLPRTIVFLEDIPKGRTGKFQRTRMAELLGVRAGADETRDFAAPGASAADGTDDPLRARMAALWCGLLQVPQVEDKDDFFERGGDSLLALELEARVEKQLGLKLDLGVQGGALRFGALLQAARSASPVPAGAGVPGIHVLRSEGAGVPLFFLHGVYSFKRLLPVLEPRNPIYALEPPDEAALLQAQGFASLVDECVERIRQVHAHGPYLLAGHSMGGVVAFETARRLLAEGERVHGVALLDSDPLGYRSATWMPKAVMNLEYQAFRIKLQLQALAKLPPSRWKAYITDKLHAVANRDPYKDAQNMVLNNFVLRPLALPTLLFRCRDEDAGRARQLGKRWGELVGPGLTVVDVPGDHETVLRTPQIEEVGVHLDRWLAELAP